MNKATVVRKARQAPATQAPGRCLCGEVRFEIDVPAVWAWHDHSAASRRAHGGACVTWVGSWRSRLRVTAGQAAVTRFEDRRTGEARSFCARCGTPLFYERPRAPRMVNIPRGLFAGRTGREPRYHLGLEEAPEWAWRGETLRPLAGFPGVMWTGPKSRPRLDGDGLI